MSSLPQSTGLKHSGCFWDFSGVGTQPPLFPLSPCPDWSTCFRSGQQNSGSGRLLWQASHPPAKCASSRGVFPAPYTISGARVCLGLGRKAGGPAGKHESPSSVGVPSRLEVSSAEHHPEKLMLASVRPTALLPRPGPEGGRHPCARALRPYGCSLAGSAQGVHWRARLRDGSQNGTPGWLGPLRARLLISAQGTTSRSVGLNSARTARGLLGIRSLLLSRPLPPPQTKHFFKKEEMAGRSQGSRRGGEARVLDGVGLLSGPPPGSRNPNPLSFEFHLRVFVSLKMAHLGSHGYHSPGGPGCGHW